MADFQFPCPLCQQLIQCDDAWTGQQIQCPVCQGALAVPANPAAAPRSSRHNPLVPVPPSKLSSRLAENAQVPATAGRNIPVRNLAPAPKKKKSRLVSALVILGVLAALGAGGYYGWGLLSQAQEKTNAKRRQVEKNADGGEMGHIANLYDVLDRTEPGGPGLGGRSSRSSGPRQRDTGAGREIPLAAEPAAADAAAKATNTLVQLPVVPPKWTMESSKAKIPEGRANGSISGADFVVETARLDKVGTAYVLTLRQGAGVSPDRGIFVYLHPKATQNVSSNKWSISGDEKSTEVTQVLKVWKTDPKYAPRQKSFSSGYLMELELEGVKDGVINGRIFLALPDTEQSVVGGIFKAVTTLGVAGAGAPTAPPGMAPGVTPAGRAAVEQRYGVQ